MSLEQIRRALVAEVPSVAHFAVLVVLADASDDSGGNCYPSQATIAKRAHLSERHVRRVLSDLALSGHLAVSTAPIGRHSAVYRLTLARTSSPDTVSTPDIKSGQARTVDRTNAHGSPDNMSAHPLRDPSETLRGAHERGNGTGPGPDDRSWLPAPIPKAELDAFRERLEAERAQRAERARLASQTAPAAPSPAPAEGGSISAVAPPEP